MCSVSSSDSNNSTSTVETKLHIDREIGVRREQRKQTIVTRAHALPTLHIGGEASCIAAHERTHVGVAV
jgi:hypothetical protein